MGVKRRNRGPIRHGAGVPPRTPRAGADNFDKATRLAIAERDGWTCTLCGRPVQNTHPYQDSYLVAGHIVAHIDGGRPTLANGRAECRGCSNSDGAKRGEEVKRARWNAAQEELRAARARIEQLENALSTTNVTNETPSATTELATPTEGAAEGDDVTERDEAVTPGRFSPGGPPAPRPRLPLAPSTTAMPHKLRFAESKPEHWSHVSYMADLLTLPPEATWPRFMTPPDSRAVGSYGADLELRAKKRWNRDLRWWQRLALRRTLEHDREGALIHPEWLWSTARQSGKSINIVEMCMWRLEAWELIGEDQNVIHVANTLRAADQAQRPARVWARQDAQKEAGWNSKRGNGTQEVSSRDELDLWRIFASEGVYGQAAGLAIVDEAWAIRAALIEDGVEPTLLERKWPQLGLISTAHSRATSLFLDRRADALDGSGTLLIEWSAQPWLPLDDRDGWRQASPHWTEQREAMMAKILRRAINGDRKAELGEPDPLISFQSQYLNRWPSSVNRDLALPGIPLVDMTLWGALEGDAEVTGPIVFGVEDNYGLSVSVAAAGRTQEGRILVECYELDRITASTWIQTHAATRPGSTVIVGGVLADDDRFADLGIATETANFSDTKAALAALRYLVSRRAVIHAHSGELTRQLRDCRVTEGSAGLRVATSENWGQVRAASWAVAAVERMRRGNPSVY